MVAQTACVRKWQCSRAAQYYLCTENDTRKKKTIQLSPSREVVLGAREGGQGGLREEVVSGGKLFEMGPQFTANSIMKYAENSGRRCVRSDPQFLSDFLLSILAEVFSGITSCGSPLEIRPYQAACVERCGEVRGSGCYSLFSPIV